MSLKNNPACAGSRGSPYGPRRQRLFTPGPTPIPERVQAAMAGTPVYHRGPEFPALLRDAVEGLQEVFPTAYDVFLLSCSGTGVMEAAVANTLCAGDRALVVQAGQFGARWTDICRAYGVEVVERGFSWGEAVDPQVVAESLRDDPGLRVVFATHSETSTGVLHDIASIGDVVRETDAMLVVDGVSSVAAHSLPLEAWNVDLAVTASQKGLMLPPGMGIAAVGPRVWKAHRRCRLPKYYWDLELYRTSQEQGRAPATLPVTLMAGLRAALQMLRSEGVRNVWARHARHALAVRRSAAVLGLTCFARRPSNALTAIVLPESVDGLALMDYMRRERGVVVGGGLGDYRGRMVRISNLGHVDDAGILEAVGAFEAGLREAGWKFEVGAGIEAAQCALTAES